MPKATKINDSRDHQPWQGALEFRAPLPVLVDARLQCNVQAKEAVNTSVQTLNEQRDHPRSNTRVHNPSKAAQPKSAFSTQPRSSIASSLAAVAVEYPGHAVIDLGATESLASPDALQEIMNLRLIR